jgi:eukaryotic-like serine/threonine-protein kinase
VTIPQQLQPALDGRYVVERELGRGGMATVYLARDLRHPRRVAIKVLRPEISVVIGDERFAREIEIAARLQHPHIVALHESGAVGSLLYYVMPYVQGESLADRLARDRQLPVEEAVRIAMEVADALEHAHRLGVVHRDIKPGNILLSEGHALVADFGIATALTAAGGDSLTQTGIALGTPHYMSPEQAASEHVDGRSDQYALGCVLYEMLAGMPPFTGPSSQAVLARHAIDRVPNIRAVRRTVAPGIEWAIEKAMAKLAADRFTTIGEFAATLAHPERMPVPHSRRRATALALGAATVLGGLLFGLNVGGLRGRLLGAAPGIQSLAVLPVANLTGDTGQVYLAEAMTDQFITDLAQIGALRVIGRTSVQRYRGTTTSAQEVGHELHVDGVLSASLQRAGSILRVSAQVSSSATGETLWAKTYDAELANVLQLESEVSRAVSHEIRIALTPTERRRLATPRPVVDPGVYAAYVRGRYFWNKRTPADFKRAVGFFTEALDLDPTYAPAYSGLADTYTQMGYASLDAPANLFPKAREAAVRAAALDSTLAEPHAALGFYNFYYMWNWSAAEQEFETAIELNPNAATVHEWYGLFLTAMGRFAAARTEERRAAELDPLSAPIASTRGWVYHYSGVEDSAVSQLRQALSLDSTNPVAHLYLGRVFQAVGRYDSAISLYQGTGRLRGWVPTVAGMGNLLGVEGRRQEAERVLENLRVMSDTQYVTAYGVALVYAALGEKDQAFAWLSKALAERTHWLVWLNRDNRWDSLRSDVRFREMVRRVGLPN